MSKFLCLGLSLEEIVTMATVGPAAAINRPELGTLEVGSIGDASVLEQRQGSFDYEDATGQVMTGEQRLFCDGVVIGGQWWPNQPD
jgi:dihydroorotase